MAKTKHLRETKKQLGQFLTPEAVAERILSKHTLRASDRVLEPGFGGGAFLLPLIERFMELRGGNLEAVLTENVWAIEIDRQLYTQTVDAIRQRWGELPAGHHLVNGDFLLEKYPVATRQQEALSLFAEVGLFDLIIGNPPFGGTVSLKEQDDVERRYGRRGGMKIKKESYSLFIVKSLDLIKCGGTLEFICSDTFLTIPTMKGLRKALMDEGRCEVVRLDEFSPETSYPMVVLKFTRGEPAPDVIVDHASVARAEIERTMNLSWQAGGEFSRYFAGPMLTDYLVASSGMTTGKNEYFVRAIKDGVIEEPYEFIFFDDPITLSREVARARLGKMSSRVKAGIMEKEERRDTRRNVRIVPRKVPESIRLPHKDYRYYNKAQPGIVFSPPRNAIFWKNEGEAVITFKQNGNWYLHGVGGAPFFGREGLTWRLISSRLDVRYLPEGYILDSGAPCAFLRPGIHRDELWFILGWMLTDTATAILKRVLNHTMNIQSKDVERLPYPTWVSPKHKDEAIRRVKQLVENAMSGELIERGHKELLLIQELYEFR